MGGTCEEKLTMKRKATFKTKSRDDRKVRKNNARVNVCSLLRSKMSEEPLDLSTRIGSIETARSPCHRLKGDGLVVTGLC